MDVAFKQVVISFTGGIIGLIFKADFKDLNM